MQGDKKGERKKKRSTDLSHILYLRHLKKMIACQCWYI